MLLTRTMFFITHHSTLPGRGVLCEHLRIAWSNDRLCMKGVWNLERGPVQLQGRKVKALIVGGRRYLCWPYHSLAFPSHLISLDDVQLAVQHYDKTLFRTDSAPEWTRWHKRYRSLDRVASLCYLILTSSGLPFVPIGRQPRAVRCRPVSFRLCIPRIHRDEEDGVTTAH